MAQYDYNFDLFEEGTAAPKVVTAPKVKPKEKIHVVEDTREVRQERVRLIGYNLHKGVTKEYLVKSNLVYDLSQRLSVAVGARHNLPKQRDLTVVGKALARYVVGLIVHDATMHR